MPLELYLTIGGCVLPENSLDGHWFVGVVWETNLLVSLKIQKKIIFNAKQDADAQLALVCEFGGDFEDLC